MNKHLIWMLLLLVFMIQPVALAEPQIPPAPLKSIYVQDYAGVLSGDIQSKINSLGSNLAARTKAQVVVVTVKSLQGAPIEEYALGVLRQWGVGDKQLNNGVVLLIAVEDRKSRIEVGYGLEGALPDGKTGRIQDEFMLPYFQQGDYNRGVFNAYQRLVSEVAKEYNVELKTKATPAPAHRQGSGFDQLPWYVQILIVIGVIALLIVDWLFFGGSLTFLLLSLLRGRGGSGGGSGGGFGGGSGGGGGSSRQW